MPDINTMLNAAYDAYEKVKNENLNMRKIIEKQNQEIADLQKAAKPAPSKKAKKGGTTDGQVQ